MSLSTCEHCGGNIPPGPGARGRCEKCGRHVFGLPTPTGEDDDVPTIRLKPTRDLVISDAAYHAALEAALARKDAALGMAVEALDEVSDSYGSHYQGGGCSCVKCRRTRRHAALAACREAMGETP